MSLIKNNIIILQIIEMNADGFGVAYQDDFPVIVAYSLPGEVIKVKIIEVLHKYAIAEIIELIEPSKNRVVAPCQYFTKCGGCSLQHLSNHGEYKFALVKSALTNIAFFGKLHPIAQISPNSRRRAVFKVNNNKLSFNQYHSKQMVGIAHCLLLEDPINSLIVPINKLLGKLGIRIELLSVMNSDSGIELLFHSNEKGNLNSDSILASFAAEHNIARIAWQFKSQSPFSLIQRVPVQLKFCDFQVDLPINSFLQVSKESTSLMVEIILEHLIDTKKILELYCGCGSFTIPMSTKANVFAVEGSELAIEALTKAAKKYQLPIQAIKQDLYQNPLPFYRINDYSQVVINPPRNGASPQIKQIALSSLVKQVILVSCSVNNFIRDAKILLNAGFILAEVYPIDQFLYTNHLEIIGIFKRI